jgi:peptidoglycan hydrolase-like protein with peptidoglycan-binding domain
LLASLPDANSEMKGDILLAANRKGVTNNTQVAIRDYYSTTTGVVLIRLNSGSEIEVGSAYFYDNDGNEWLEVGYAYKKHGYMMSEFITITDSTKKYYMIDTLKDLGDANLAYGSGDPYTDGPVHNLQRALNAMANLYDYTGATTVTVDGAFGSQTDRAVKAAQTFMNCTSDGIVGPHTKARLYECAWNMGGWPLAENAD